MRLDQTLVPIRERSFLDLLDLSLVVVRDRPVTLGLAALVGAAPFLALNVWLLSLPDFPAGALIYLLALESPWATAPLTLVLGGLMFGARPTVGAMLRTLLRSLPALVFFQVVIRGFLVISGIFYLLIPAKLVFLNEVILLERERWPVIKRTSMLCDRRGGDLIGQWIAELTVGVLFVCAFWLGTQTLAQALFETELTWETPGLGTLAGVRFQFALWLAIEFFAVARFLTYIDQRIRLEGWEVKLRMRAVGQSLREREDRAW